MDQTVLLSEENQRLRKAVEELSILNDLARVISSTMTQDAVIEAVVKRAVRATGGQQGMITMVDEESPTEMKTLIRAQNSASNMQTFHLNQNILGWMMINKKPLLANDLHNDPRFSGVHVEGSFHSLLCVPLLVKNRMIAILAVFNKKVVAAFTEDDKRLLSIIAAQSAQILENARLYEQEKSLQHMQEEVRFAAKILSELLPKEFPRIPGCDIAGEAFRRAIGGDYFVHPVDKTRIAITLGDVTGKAPAAMLMSNVGRRPRTDAREQFEGMHHPLQQAALHEHQRREIRRSLQHPRHRRTPSGSRTPATTIRTSSRRQATSASRPAAPS